MMQAKPSTKLPAVLAAAISLTLIMGCADQTTAPDALVLDGPSFARVPTLELPWKGNLVGTVTSVQWAGVPWDVSAKSLFDGRCSRESTYVMHAAVVGEVTVLGRVTFYISHCGQFGVGYTDGRWFGVAADGSALWGHHAVGDGGVIGFDPVTGQFYTQDEWEIDGGTGRFAGATGGGWERAVFNDPIALLSGQESYLIYQEGTIRSTPGKGNVPNLLPFKGTGTWWYVLEGDPSPCLEDFEDSFFAVIPVFSEGEGTNTHLGRLKIAVTQCYGWDGSLPPAPVFLSHSVTWTAANGDQLLGYGSIYDDPPIMATQDGVTYELVPIRLVGGTGRFRNAEGWFRVTGDFSMGAQVGGNYVTEGWISTVGSKR
jgi:hypothetical protein